MRDVKNWKLLQVSCSKNDQAIQGFFNADSKYGVHAAGQACDITGLEAPAAEGYHILGFFAAVTLSRTTGFEPFVAGKRSHLTICLCVQPFRHLPFPM